MKQVAYPLDSALVAQAIRCEMRDGFITILTSALHNTQYGSGRSGIPTPDLSREHFLGLQAPPKVDADRWRARQEADAFAKFLKTDYLKVRAKDEPTENPVLPLVETYGPTFVAYKFEFDMATADSVEANLDLISVFTRGSVTTPIGGSFEGKRRATRQFVLADRVSELLTNLPTIRVCNYLRKDKRLPNGAYPIAGKLDLLQVIKNFGTVNQSGNLIGQYSEAELLTSAADNPPRPAMTEKLVFTTTVKKGVEPTLELAKPLHGTDVKGAGLKLKNERVDVHTLTLVLQLPGLKGPTVASARSAAEMKGLGSYGAAAAAAAKEINRLETEQRRSRILNAISDF